MLGSQMSDNVRARAWRERHRAGTESTQSVPRQAAAGVSATRRVLEAVLELLRTGNYRTGDKLPTEHQLSAQSGVGRSAVREALRELAALHLIEVRHGSGTYVRNLRPDLLRANSSFTEIVDRAARSELLEVRAILEPEAAALAANRADLREIERLELDVLRLEEAVRDGYRPPEDLGFHLDLVRAAHNQALLRLAGPIVSYYARDEWLPSVRDVEEHREVVAAVASRDAPGARAAMLVHLQTEADLLGGATGAKELSVDFGAGHQ